MKARDVIDGLTFVSIITIIFGIGFATGMLVMRSTWLAIGDVEQTTFDFWETANVLVVGLALLVISNICGWAYQAGLKKGKGK